MNISSQRLVDRYAGVPLCALFSLLERLRPARWCSLCLPAYNHRYSPCDEDNQCLKQISPEAALAKSLEVLAQ